MNTIYTSGDALRLYAIAALIGAAVAFVGALILHALQGRPAVDQSLRDTRVKLYKPLWIQTQLPPRWYKTQTTYDQLTQLSQSLNTWYFSDGGIYLSNPARNAYLRLQKSLARVAAKPGSELITAHDNNMLRRKCRSLRNELSKDLLSRSTTVAPS